MLPTLLDAIRRRVVTAGVSRVALIRWTVLGIGGAGCATVVIGAVTGLWQLAVVGVVAIQLAAVALAVRAARGQRRIIARLDAQATQKHASLENPWLDDYVALARRRGYAALEQTALRNHSTQMRDVLAHAASRGRASYGQLEDLMERLRQPALRPAALEAMSGFDRRWLMTTARVVALQGRGKTDQCNALTMYEFVQQMDRSPAASPAHGLTYFQLLYAAGKYDEAASFLRQLTISPSYLPYLEADLCNPFIDIPSADQRRWLTSINRIFESYGLEPLELVADSSQAPFDFIRSSPSSMVDQGPLVSVVMTTFDPDQRMDIAVESILAQSWRNLELIIVDDGSADDGRAHVEKWEGRDQRIRILQLPVNQGTYPARNAAIGAARGEFITFQDADDWSHPRRIERQVIPMLENERLVATRSTCARATEQLVFSWVGYRPTRFNASSLMFRVDPIVKELGYFDNVRKAADTEYHRRIEAIHPDGCLDLDEAPLALVRLTTGSLSRGDFRPGWHAPARLAYRSAYGRWHEQIAAGHASPYLAAGGQRAFAAPGRFLSAVSESPHYDVVLMGDWRRYGGPQRSMIEEIRALSSAGLRVGIAHMEALRFMTGRMDPLCGAIQDMINDGAVDHVLVDEGASTNILIIRYPPILQCITAAPVQLAADKVFVLANQAPYEKDGSDHRYVVTTCSRNTQELFGREPVWVPQGPMVRKLIKPIVPRQLLADFDIPGIIDVNEWYSDRTKFRGSVPIIGRHSRDDFVKWPTSPEMLRSVYPMDGSVEVRVLGGAKSPMQLLGLEQAPPAWKVWRKGEVDPIDFLAGIDFFVYYHHPQMVEAFGRAVMEAMASGAVAVLPPHFEEVFGEGPIYVPPKHALAAVRDLYAQPDRYYEHSARSVNSVRERFGYESYVALISQLLKA